MAYLKNIIESIEETFHVKVQGQYQPRIDIECVRFLTAASGSLGEHDRNHLYIHKVGDGLPHSLPPYILFIGDTSMKCEPGAVSTSTCSYNDSTMGGLSSVSGTASHAPRSSVPRDSAADLQPSVYGNPPISASPLTQGYLSIQKELDIYEVFNTIQSCIYKHFKVKIKREELFFSLHSNNGIEGLAHVAHDYLNNPVTICDTSFAILAASPIVRDPQNLEERQGRMYLRQERFQDMEDRNILKHIYSSTTPYITSLANHPYKWVFESIRIEHSVVGYICVRGSVREFTEDDMEFIDVLAKMLSVEMQKDSSFSHPTGLKYEYFLTELLEGHFERTEYIISHLVQLGRTQTPFYTVLILKFTGACAPPRSPKNYYDQLLSLLPNSMVVLYQGNLTILLPSANVRPLSEARRKRFATFLQMNHMRAFVSYTYMDISKSHIHYRQIRELSDMYADHGNDHESCFVYFQDYYLEHLFYRCADTRLLNASIHPDIRRLLEYDHQMGSEYSHTLQVYLANNRNALASARELHIHKSTFFYRLGKMEDLFGIRIDDAPTLFAYEYSYRMVEYLGLT